MLQMLEFQPLPEAHNLEEGRNLAFAVLRSELSLFAMDLAGVDVDLSDPPAAILEMFGDELTEADYALGEHIHLDIASPASDGGVHVDGVDSWLSEVNFHLTSQPVSAYEATFLQPTRAFLRRYVWLDAHMKENLARGKADDVLFRPQAWRTLRTGPTLVAFHTKGPRILAHGFRTTQFPRISDIVIAEGQQSRRFGTR